MNGSFGEAIKIERKNVMRVANRRERESDLE